MKVLHLFSGVALHALKSTPKANLKAHDVFVVGSHVPYPDNSVLRANVSNHQTNRGKPQKIDFAQTL